MTRRRYGEGAVASGPDGYVFPIAMVKAVGSSYELRSYDFNSSQYIYLHSYSTKEEACNHLDLLGGTRPIEEVARFYH